MPLSNLTSFHSTAKIAPRMHQMSSFWAQKSDTLSPHPTSLGALGASILAPLALGPHVFSRFTPGSWSASWNTKYNQPENLSNSVKKTQNKGYYGVQGHSGSSRSVPIESPYAIFY